MGRLVMEIRNRKGKFFLFYYGVAINLWITYFNGENIPIYFRILFPVSLIVAYDIFIKERSIDTNNKYELIVFALSLPSLVIGCLFTLTSPLFFIIWISVKTGTHYLLVGLILIAIVLASAFIVGKIRRRTK